MQVEGVDAMIQYELKERRAKTQDKLRINNFDEEEVKELKQLSDPVMKMTRQGEELKQLIMITRVM